MSTQSAQPLTFAEALKEEGILVLWAIIGGASTSSIFNVSEDAMIWLCLGLYLGLLAIRRAERRSGLDPTTTTQDDAPVEQSGESN